MSRTLCFVAAALVVLGAGPGLGQAASQVADLRQHNTAIMQASNLQRAVFVREQRSAEVNAALPRLLTQVQQQGITSVFVNVSDFISDPVTGIDRAFRWSRYLSELHRLGVSVYGVVGDSGSMSDYGTLLRAVDQLARFEAMGQPGASFDGLLIQQPLLSTLTPPPPPPVTTAAAGTLDPNAPPPAPAAPGAQQGLLDPVGFGAAATVPHAADVPGSVLTSLSDQVVMGSLLDTLDRLRRYARTRVGGRSLRLGVTIPAWLTGEFSWRGQTKELGQQFVDVTDFVVVHNLPNNTTDVGVAAQHLIRYCGEQRKPLLLRLELLYALRPSPALLSLFGRDRLFVESTIDGLLEQYSGAPGFGGVALDDLTHLLAMPNVRSLKPPAADATGTVAEPIDLDRPLPGPAEGDVPR